MIVRPLIGLAVAFSLAGCTGASELAESEPAANSSPPAPSAAAAPSIAPGASDVVHDLTTGIESPLPDAIQALGGIELRAVPGRNQAGVRREHRRVQPGDGRVAQRHLGPPGHPSQLRCLGSSLVTVRRPLGVRMRQDDPGHDPLARAHRPPHRSPRTARTTVLHGGRASCSVHPNHAEAHRPVDAPSGADEAPCSSPRRRGATFTRWEEQSRFIAFKERSNPPPGGPISADSPWSTSMASNLGR